MEERTLTGELRRLRPQQARTNGPLVSLVVVNRDGDEHLRRLLDGLDKRTAYRSFEMVLVDNGSTDESPALLDGWDGAKRVILNGENQSFSAANNQGIRAATGELVLILNNDVDPIHPHWLGFMVESLLDGAGAVGAMLVYPKRARQQHAPVHDDLTVQHLGVCFEYSRWGVRATNAAMGSDPLLVTQPAVREVPVATAACLLARRTDLLETPFDEQYWYGGEDWDLSLRLQHRGPVVVDERAILFHHEYGTQDRHMSEAWLEARQQNHRWFNDLWGPSIRRRIRTELTQQSGQFFYRHDRPPVALIVTDKAGDPIAKRLRADATANGWEVTADERSAPDVAIALAPPRSVHRFEGHDLSAALVLGREQDWARSGALDAAKQVRSADSLTDARLSGAWASGISELAHIDQPDLFSKLVADLAPRSDALRIGVSTCAPTWDKAQFWGDTHMARGLMRAFRRLGHETSELIKPDWRSPRAASCDVVIHLRGLARRPIARGQWNMLWIISHPDRLERGECDDYDIVASASLSHAESLSEQLGRQVHYLPQATDTDTFKIGNRSVDYEASVMYVGNARWPSRRAPRWLMRNGRRFDLYGQNWADFPEATFLRADYIPNQDLPAAYRSADVLVADHHGSMRAGGFVANRLFDVLASGGLVLTDDVAGLDELFGDVVPSYSTAQELESQLRLLLAEPSLRRRLAAEGRRIVMSKHTLDHRASELLRLLDGLSA